MPHTIKEGDTPTLRWSLGRDITGATCTAHIADRATGDLVIDRAATIEDATQGIVALTLAPGELPVGRYRVEIETDTSGVILTHPDDGYESIIVVPELD